MINSFSFTSGHLSSWRHDFKLLVAYIRRRPTYRARIQSSLTLGRTTAPSLEVLCNAPSSHESHQHTPLGPSR